MGNNPLSGKTPLQLQRRIMLLSMLGILLTGIVVGLTTAIPLFQRAKAQTEDAFQYSVRVQALAISQLLQRWEDIAFQLTSRSRIRDTLEQFNRGEISAQALQRFSVNKLEDALHNAPDVAALVRLDAHNRPVIHIGRDMPAGPWPIPATDAHDSELRGPVKLDGKYYLLLGAPIRNRADVRVGTDVVLFRLAPLTAILRKTRALTQGAEVYLSQPGRHQILETNESGISFVPVTKAGPIEQAIAKAADGAYGMLSTDVMGRPRALIYAPLNEKGWGMALSVEDDVLYAPALRELILPLLSILFMIAVGALGTRQLIRPLAQRVVTQAAEQRSLLEYAQGFVFRIDLDGTLDHVSDGIEKVIGYTPEEVARNPGKFLAESGMNSEARRIHRENLATRGEGQPYLIEMRHRAGHLLTLEINERSFEEAGQIAGTLGVARDVTSRVAAERALRENEERLRTVINATPDIICFKDGQGRWLEANEADLQLFRLEGVDYRGKRDSELAAYTHPLYKEAFLGCELTDEMAWQGGRPSRAEEVIPVVDGEPRVFDILKVPLFTAGGERKGLVVVGRDISERKWAEDELLLAASVFQGSDEGIMIADAQRRIVRVNHAFSEITGYMPAQVEGMSMCSLFNEQQENAAFCEELWTLLDEAGSWQGELWYRRRNAELFPAWQNISAVRDEQGQIVRYIGLFTDISDRKHSEERIHYLAHYDLLTNLPNRVLLNDRLGQAMERCRRHGDKLALLFLDLDRFKNVNDSLGHPVGDRLLQTVARRLDRVMRRQDTIARLGGDEFLLVIEELHEPDEAAQMARKVLNTLSEPVNIGEQEIVIGGSIGISLYPSDGEDAESLIKNADAAMYRAKETGRNTYQFYTPELTRRSFERLDLENHLRQAVKRGELVLYYQPQATVARNEIIGAEALLRWQHPERGLLTPNHFIPLAEETGLIEPVGRWVLHAACVQGRIWQEQGRPLRVAVNLAGYQIVHGDIVNTVREVLTETGLDPQLLELEITEGFVLEHAEEGIRTLAELKALGISLAIDDFGTGYSSLSYLKRLPIDRLKIDRSFVRDIPDDRDDVAIATTIISMAGNLNLEVIAEGVESEAQLAFLRDHFCDEYQGYYLARPLPLAALEALIARHRA